jgi:hypothetical protein
MGFLFHRNNAFDTIRIHFLLILAAAIELTIRQTGSKFLLAL